MSHEITFAKMNSLVCANLIESIINENATFNDASDFEDMIETLADYYTTDDVVYTTDAISICDSSDFDQYYEECDFSECKTAFDCVMLEAQTTYINAQMKTVKELAEDLKTQAAEIFEYVQNSESGAVIKTTKSDPFGYASHTSETEDGLYIHENLENELQAVCVKITLDDNCFYLSACWDK